MEAKTAADPRVAKVERALISVSDKTGVEAFARALSQRGIEILSTGGTAKLLAKAGVRVREVSDYTGSPEMMDGRVKTLHPKVHGGLLALRDDARHQASMREHGIGSIDLLVVNLYPFEETVADPQVSREDAIEQIDVGGPAMLRAASKNHRWVAVVTDPGDYGRVLDELERSGGSVSPELKRELALKAFALTSRYDAAIHRWLAAEERRLRGAEAEFPSGLGVGATKVAELRYGENPHQKAAFYRTGGVREASVATAEVLGGKALSYNNLLDLDAALALAKEFDRPFAAVIKHNNPCGAAVGETIAQALARAWNGDPLSAFGSVLALTRPFDAACADFLASGGRFVEAIAAPSFEAEALDVLVQKPKWGRNVRLLACGPIGLGGPAARDPELLELRPVVGGLLAQTRDLAVETEELCKPVTKAVPTPAQLADLRFGALVAKHVKSNAIVLARGGQVVGVGAGQMSRVDSVFLALRKAGEQAKGAVLASDAFFPFPDGVEAAIAGGVSAILQPGGSVKDPDVIAACDKAGVPMVFTGLRHFRH